MKTSHSSLRTQFPLWQYLTQPLFSPKTCLHPARFWQNYKLQFLEQCWSHDPVQLLERCWAKDLRSGCSHDPFSLE